MDACILVLDLYLKCSYNPIAFDSKNIKLDDLEKRTMYIIKVP